MPDRHETVGEAPSPLDARFTSDGIYGVIISAAVMASWRDISIVRLAAGALATLLIYWAAERYARVVAARIAAERRPTWAEFRAELAEGWEIVTTSFIPLVVLLVVAAVGVDDSNAVLAALVASTVLLLLAGWEVGRGGRLGRAERLVSALVAGAFGFTMILLKTNLH